MLETALPCGCALIRHPVRRGAWLQLEARCEQGRMLFRRLRRARDLRQAHPQARVYRRCLRKATAEFRRHFQHQAAWMAGEEVAA